jgi:hypothetical protein
MSTINMKIVLEFRSGTCLSYPFQYKTTDHFFQFCETMIEDFGKLGMGHITVATVYLVNPESILYKREYDHVWIVTKGSLPLQNNTDSQLQ